MRRRALSRIAHRVKPWEGSARVVELAPADDGAANLGLATARGVELHIAADELVLFRLGRCTIGGVIVGRLVLLVGIGRLGRLVTGIGPCGGTERDGQRQGAGEGGRTEDTCTGRGWLCWVCLFLCCCFPFVGKSYAGASLVFVRIRTRTRMQSSCMQRALSCSS